MTELNAQAQTFYEQTLVWDAHAGFEAWPHTDLEVLQVWKRAGVDFLSLNVGYDVQQFDDCIKALASFRRWLQRSDEFVIASSASDVDKAKAAGQMAVAFDIEGMRALGGSLDMVHLLYELGVRQMLFAYNRNNDAGGGCHDNDQGLTAFGRAVIQEMNAVGMLVDCSHCGYKTTMEAMEHSQSPVIFSHSNPRSLHDHERNIVDEQVRTCAATGGVIGINGIGLFLGDNNIHTERLADHIEYLLDLVGDQHVGIGLDYFGDADSDEGFNEVLAANADFWPASQYPDGAVECAAPSQLPGLTFELIQRGYNQSTVSAVLGGNFHRVASTVWG